MTEVPHKVNSVTEKWTGIRHMTTTFSDSHTHEQWQQQCFGLVKKLKKSQSWVSVTRVNMDIHSVICKQNIHIHTVPYTLNLLWKPFFCFGYSHSFSILFDWHIFHIIHFIYLCIFTELIYSYFLVIFWEQWILLLGSNQN